MPPAKNCAIVTDGLWRKSLSAIRSLGKAGFRVTVLGDSWFTTGFWSRFTTRRILAPLASRNPDAFGRAIRLLLAQEPGAVILPMEEASLAWLLAHHDELEGRCHMVLPSLDAFGLAQDKGRTLDLARELGLPCPRTWQPSTAQEFSDIALSLAPGEFVVKPRSGTGSSGVAYGTPRSRQEWMEHWLRFGPMLIQERVPAEGTGQGVSLLFDLDGQCIAAFAHERLQQYPNSGGPSTDRRSIIAPALVEMSVALMRKLQWRGIAMVEWKVDPRDGQPRLMEINPRFWGSLELAVRAGIDFPSLYARAALGEKLEPQARYEANVRCRWMLPGEILRYLTQKKERREGLLRFFRGLPGLAEEWDSRDIPGALSTILCTAAGALNPRYWKYLRRG